MNKRNAICLVALFAALGVQASVLEEWSFLNDRAGTVPTDTVNSGTDGSTFESGGAGILEADGAGHLLSTPSAASLYDLAVELDADIMDTSAPLFLRCDIDYGFSPGANTVGNSIAISFIDETGANLAGIVLAYDPNAETFPQTHEPMLPLAEDLQLSGTISAVVKVEDSILTVWYADGGGASFPETETGWAANVISGFQSSIEGLRIQATGNASGDAGDFVGVKNIRVADSWAEITGPVEEMEVGGQTSFLNEWVFDRDPANLTLAEAENSGMDEAVFSEDLEQITQTDGSGGLVCSNEAVADGLWVDGAILTADVQDSVFGEIRYLRYDLDYDMTAIDNDSGTLLGLAFVDGTGANLAGVALKYGSSSESPPSGIPASTLVDFLPLAGTVSVIAKVDLGNSTMEVWWNLSGGNDFAEGNPDATTAIIGMASIDELQFRATGDMLPGYYGKAVVIDNIRTAATWDDIVKPITDLQSPPGLSAAISDQLEGNMQTGQTNTISVVIEASVSPATFVYSELSHDGAPGDFTIVADNAPVPVLGENRPVTNTYEVVAHVNGRYIFTARARSDQVDGNPVELEMIVGEIVQYQSHSVSGAFEPGIYQPGDTLDIEVVSIARGGAAVFNIVNTLTAESGGFAISPASDTYPSLAPGETATSTYQVGISPSMSPGIYTFHVRNSIAGGMQSDKTFTLEVSLPSSQNLSLAFNVVEGETGTGILSLINQAALSRSFTVQNNGDWPLDAYQVEPQPADRTSFLPVQFAPETLFPEWDEGESEPMELGFDFGIWGERCDSFSVSSAGSLSLFFSSSGETVEIYPELFEIGRVWYDVVDYGPPVNEVREYSTNLVESAAYSYSTDSVRYKLTDSELIVSWGVDPDASFGAGELELRIHSDGTFRFLHALESGGGNLSIAKNYKTEKTDKLDNKFIIERYMLRVLETVPYSARDSFLVTSTSWVSVDPEEGTSSSLGTQAIVFTADAAEQSPGIVSFVAPIIWSDGVRDTVNVMVNILSASPQLSVPSPFEFSGPVFTKTGMTIANTGNAELAFTVTDLGLQGAGYSSEEAQYGWIGLSSFSLDPGQLGSETVEIGFPFPFFGNTYSNMVVNEDGSIALSGGSAITPFSAGLSYDANSSVQVFSDPAKERLAVAWKDMAQSGGGDQTFQAELHRDGTIRFNYDQLSGDWFDGAIQLVDPAGTVEGTLERENETVFVETNITAETTMVTNWVNIGGIEFPVVEEGETIYTTNIVTTYADTVNRKSILFAPGAQRVIVVSPTAGTLPVAGTMELEVCGDARATGPGVYNTTLAFNYAGISTESLIIFIVNSDPVAAADMWGGDAAVAAEHNPVGPYTLFWAEPSDEQSRIYTVWYTTSLEEEWEPIAVLTNRYDYVDEDPVRNAAPASFYKMTVE